MCVLIKSPVSIVVDAAGHDRSAVRLCRMNGNVMASPPGMMTTSSAQKPMCGCSRIPPSTVAASPVSCSTWVDRVNVAGVWLRPIRCPGYCRAVRLEDSVSSTTPPRISTREITIARVCPRWGASANSVGTAMESDPWRGAW